MITTDKGKAILEELLKGSKHTQLVNIVSSQKATMITTEQRQILTEWLGEKIHESKYKDSRNDFISDNGWYVCICGHTERNYEDFADHLSTRTFTTWNDFGAVVEKLRTSGNYQEVGLMFEAAYWQGNNISERFCILVADAIKEGTIR